MRLLAYFSGQEFEMEEQDEMEPIPAGRPTKESLQPSNDFSRKTRHDLRALAAVPEAVVTKRPELRTL